MLKSRTAARANLTQQLDDGGAGVHGNGSWFGGGQTGNPGRINDKAVGRLGWGGVEMVAACHLEGGVR
ncbi:hypothetical protein NL676_013505 [Syzygium grande]|nr:hypothetical protein NL676_013505 [Syzygium grande]